MPRGSGYQYTAPHRHHLGDIIDSQRYLLPGEEVFVSEYNGLMQSVRGFAEQERVLVITDLQTLSDDLVLGENMYLKVMPSGLINHGIHNIRMHSPANIIASPLQQIFQGTGVVTFDYPGIIFPDYWKRNVMPGVTDMTEASRAALQSAAGYLKFLPHTYLITDGMSGMEDNNHISGFDGSTLLFNPESEAILFRLYNEGTGYGPKCCSISNLRFTSSNSIKKTIVKAEDVSRLRLENLQTIGATWTGGNSIGLDLSGRDLLSVRNVSLATERPIYLNANKHVDTLNYDNDVCHFENITLTAWTAGQVPSAYPCVGVSPEATLFNVTFDGNQSWNMGTHGFHMDHVNVSDPVSIALVFKNVRWEQGKQDGYGIHIKTAGNPITQINIDNYWSPATGTTQVNGILLYGVVFASIQNSSLFVDVGHVPLSLNSIAHLVLLNVRDNPACPISLDSRIRRLGVPAVGDSGWNLLIVDGATGEDSLWMGQQPVYADNDAALAGGLVDGQTYRTANGQIMVAYTP